MDNNNNIVLCYCSNQLKGFRSNWRKDWFCKHCYRTYNKNIKTFYKCGTGNTCKFRQINGGPYRVCIECYNYMIDNDNGNGNSYNWNKFVLKKISNQINYLS